MRGWIALCIVLAAGSHVKGQGITPLMIVDLKDSNGMTITGGFYNQPTWSPPSVWFNGSFKAWEPGMPDGTCTFSLTGTGAGKYGIYTKYYAGTQLNQANWIAIDVGGGELVIPYEGAGGATIEAVDDFGRSFTLYRLDLPAQQLGEGGTVNVSIRNHPSNATEPGAGLYIDVFALVLEETGGEPGGPDPDPEDPDPEEPPPEEPELDYDCDCDGVEDGEQLADPDNDTDGNGVLDVCQDEEGNKKPGGCGKLDEKEEEDKCCCCSDGSCDICAELAAIKEILENIRDEVGWKDKYDPDDEDRKLGEHPTYVKPPSLENLSPPESTPSQFYDLPQVSGQEAGGVLWAIPIPGRGTAAFGLTSFPEQYNGPLSGSSGWSNLQKFRQITRTFTGIVFGWVFVMGLARMLRQY